MLRSRRPFLSVVLGIALGLLISPVTSFANNRPLHFSGHLDDNELPFEGSLEVVFTIYTDATSQDTTAVFWSESQNVLFENGDFNVALGASTENPLPAFFGSNDALYLGIAVGTDDEMAPRLSLDSVPFAKHAERADYIGSFNEATLSNIGAQATHNEEAITSLQETVGTGGTETLGTQVTNNTTLLQNIDTALTDLLSNVQRPHLTSCADGYSIRTVDSQGNVICDPDDDTHITDSIGNGETGKVIASTGATTEPSWQSVHDLGTIKVHRQIDGAPIEIQEKVNEVYMVDVTPDKVGIVQPLDHDIIERLCKDDDGCQYTIHMINYASNKPGMSAFRGPVSLYLSQASNWWRNGNDTEGIDGNGSNTNIGPWDCYLTDGETSTNSSNGRLDNGAGFGVLNVKGGEYSDTLTTCRFIFKD